MVRITLKETMVIIIGICLVIALMTLADTSTDPGLPTCPKNPNTQTRCGP